MYSTHNKGKSAVAERMIRTLKNKIYQYMTSVSKNVYIYKLDDKVNKYNNIYHSTIKMSPVDVKLSTYIDFNVEKMRKIVNLNLEIMQEHRNKKTIFKKGYVPLWSEDVFLIKNHHVTDICY